MARKDGELCRNCIHFGYGDSVEFQKYLAVRDADPYENRPAKSTCKKLWEYREKVGLPSGEVTHTYADQWCSQWEPAQ